MSEHSIPAEPVTIDGNPVKTDRHNYTYDQQAGVTHHLAETTGGDWFHWTTETRPNGNVKTVHGRGRHLQLVAGSLDETTIRNTIHSEATDAIDHYQDHPDHEQPTTVIEDLQKLIQNVDDIGTYLHNRWVVSGREKLYKSIFEGEAHVNQDTAWTTNEHPGFADETRLLGFGVELESNDIIEPILQNALNTALKEHRREEVPNLEYEVGIRILERRP